MFMIILRLAVKFCRNQEKWHHILMNLYRAAGYYLNEIVKALLNNIVVLHQVEDLVEIQAPQGGLYSQMLCLNSNRQMKWQMKT